MICPFAKDEYRYCGECKLYIDEECFVVVMINTLTRIETLLETLLKRK